jgi:hypothetical protein
MAGSCNFSDNDSKNDWPEDRRVGVGRRVGTGIGRDIAELPDMKPAKLPVEP